MNAVHRRFACVGLLAGVVVAGIAGCDSTPAPPNEPSPTVPKQDIGKVGKGIPKSIKNRPVQPEEK